MIRKWPINKKVLPFYTSFSDSCRNDGNLIFKAYCTSENVFYFCLTLGKLKTTSFKILILFCMCSTGTGLLQI